MKTVVQDEHGLADPPDQERSDERNCEVADETYHSDHKGQRPVMGMAQILRPAGKRTAVGLKPFLTIKATAIGTNTPQSATAPAISARSKRIRFGTIAPLTLGEEGEDVGANPGKKLRIVLTSKHSAETTNVGGAAEHRHRERDSDCRPRREVVSRFRRIPAPDCGCGAS